MIETKLQLPNYVVSYLRYHNKSTDITVDIRTPLGRLLLECFEPSDVVQHTSAKGLTILLPERNNADKHKRVGVLPRVEHLAADKDFRCKPHRVKLDAVDLLVKTIRQMMEAELFAQLDQLHNQGLTEKKAGKKKETILRFLVKYDVGDEMTYHGLVKKYNRSKFGYD